MKSGKSKKNKMNQNIESGPSSFLDKQQSLKTIAVFYCIFALNSPSFLLLVPYLSVN